MSLRDQKNCHCEELMFLMGDVALILPGAKLNAQSTARRANYMDVICNLLSVWL